MLVASATLLGLYAQQRYGVGQQIFVNMLTANAYANADDFIRYEGKQPRRQVDGELYGISALYRLYPTEQGWVFLAAPTDADGLASAPTRTRSSRAIRASPPPPRATSMTPRWWTC